MSGSVILVLLLILMLAALPSWPHSRRWGFYPSGILALVLVILAILLLTGKF